MNKIRNDLKTYTANGYVDSNSDNLGYLFQNVGQVNVNINGFVLQPYDTLDTRQYNEQDVTRYLVTFQAGETGVKALNVLTKTLVK